MTRCPMCGADTNRKALTQIKMFLYVVPLCSQCHDGVLAWFNESPLDVLDKLRVKSKDPASFWIEQQLKWLFLELKEEGYTTITLHGTTMTDNLYPLDEVITSCSDKSYPHWRVGADIYRYDYQGNERLAYSAS